MSPPLHFKFQSALEPSLIASSNASAARYFGTDGPGKTLGSSAVRFGSLAIASQAGCMAIRLVSSLILARLLAPSDFGLFAMVIALTAALLIFKDLGLCDAIIQSPRITHGQITNLFWINFAVSLGTSLALAALSPLIALFYGEPRLIGIATVWSLVIVIGGASAQHVALLKRGMFFVGLSVVGILGALISTAIAIFAAWRGAGYWSLVLREVSCELVLAIGAWFLCSWRPGRPVRGAGIRPLLAFGGHTIFSFIVKRSIRNLDRTLLGWSVGSKAVGLYHTAFELAALPASQISEALRNVAVSALSKIRSEPALFRKFYLKAIRNLAFFAFAGTAFLVIGSEDLVLLMLGPKWVESGPLFRILSLSAGISMIGLTHVWLHFALGRADRLARWSLLEGLCMASAFFIGLRFGATGVAWSYTIGIHVLTVFGLWYAGSPIDLGVRDILRAIWRSFVCAGIAGFISWYLVVRATSITGPFPRILAFGLSLVVFYLLFVVVLSRGPEPIREAFSLLKKALPGRPPGKPLILATLDSDPGSSH